MKLIIAGTRDLELEPRQVNDAVTLFKSMRPEITEIVSGNSGCIDIAGEYWASRAGLPVKLFPANWDKYGKSAGPRRNREMADYADAALVIWDGKSRGSKNMIEEMKDRNKVCLVITMAKHDA